MALGTPVSGTVAYSSASGPSVGPPYPAGIAAKDIVVLIIGQKPSTANTGTVTTPTGWTLRESLTAAGGYGTTFGADVGNTNLFIYTKDVVSGTETGNLTVTLGTNNITWGIIVHIPSGGSSSYSVGTADGSRTTAPTSGVAFTTLLTNGTTAPNFQAGDIAIWGMSIPTDIFGGAGFSAHTITSTGTTFGTPVELREAFSGNGLDGGGYAAYAIATAGSSTAAPTVGATATGVITNVRGPIALVRIRDTTQQLTPTRYDEVNDFFSPTVSQASSAQELAAELYTNTNSFFSVAAVALSTMAPVRYNNTNIFYVPSITQTGPDQTLTASRYDSLNVFYSASLAQSSATQALIPSLFTNTQTFYAPSATATSSLAPSLFTNSQTFYGAAAINLNIIVPPMFADSDFIFPPVVSLAGEPQVLTASLFTNTNTFFTTTVVDPPVQPILGSGSLVRPRRKFRPAILIDLPEQEEVLPDVNAKAILAGLSASVTVGSVIATSPDPINSRTKIGFTQIEAYISNVEIRSSWNDPSDEELLFILDFALN